MTAIYVCLSLPERHMAPDGRQLMPELVLAGDLASPSLWGRNTIRCAPQTIQVSHIYYQDRQHSWQHIQPAPFQFDFTFFTPEQRRARDAAYIQLAELIQRPIREVDTLYPFIILIDFDEATILYHHMAVGRRGSLFVAYDQIPASQTLHGPADVVDAIHGSLPAWIIARPNFNENCWFSWPKTETERKFTFTAPVDIWKLAQSLHRTIDEGRLAHFIPEFNDEFQVWDFDNYLFEVFAPEAEVGYVSFIPQANGLTTIKHKRFSADSEVRHEQVINDVDIGVSDFEEYARTFTKGQVRALPPFRRKQVAVPIESVETGNLYGYYIDICRIHADQQGVLCQCEIELNRSRTMRYPSEVMEDYERVCTFTRDFLRHNNYSFNEGYYSKLSFLRDYISRKGS